MPEDIRFSKKAATLTHDSARGRVVRNTDNFTRGSQLFHHQMMMTWAGVRLPIFVWFFTTLVVLVILSFIYFQKHEIQLVLMRTLSVLWDWVALDPMKAVNLKLPNGRIAEITMHGVPFHPAVQAAWETAKRISLASAVAGAFICAPLTIWFVDYSRKRGSEILKERHERGAILIDRDTLANEVRRHNAIEHAKECAARQPAVAPDSVLKQTVRARTRAGFHVPYQFATVPMPWRLEQSHAMLIGTTGSGKTTELKKIVRQARGRGHRCVIFDLTGSFVESFYDPKTDIILNPMDRRCQPWSIFNDCDNYAEFMSAASALIPTGHNAEDDFWQKAARTLFVEMCMKMLTMNVRSNGGLAYYLMQADLKSISRQLENTVAASLVATQAAKMAESIRATFTANANVMRFLPEPAAGEEGFSINKWMTQDVQEGSILFITSTHPDLVLNRPLLTLWMDLAVNSLFRMGRTRNLRTWFLLDEVHALHRLPAIEHGLQTARAVGGAFILGMHSFDKLAETYGENGAVNLGSLARTKLVLATADIETAKRCSDFIGNREVRQMDEAYSYGYNNTRDASTITPRKQIENLVMPDDITNLPSLHGFVKFPDGFPAARIKLEWEDYPVRAEGFERVTTMRAADFTPPSDDSADVGEGGREGDAPENEPIPVMQIEETEKSEAEKAAEVLREAVEGGVQQHHSDDEKQIAATRDERASSEPAQIRPGDKRSVRGNLRWSDHETDPQREKSRQQRSGEKGDRNPLTARPQRPDQKTSSRQREDDQESEITREDRRGFGVEQKHREAHPEAESDLDMDVER